MVDGMAWGRGQSGASGGSVSPCPRLRSFCLLGRAGYMERQVMRRELRGWRCRGENTGGQKETQSQRQGSRDRDRDRERQRNKPEEKE